LYYNNTSEYCDADDIYEVKITNNQNSFNLGAEFKLKDITSGPINISPFMLIDDSINICVTIVNRRTLDTCHRCKSFYCIPHIITPSIKSEDNDVLLKSSSYLDSHPDEFFDVIPNPVENKFDIIFKDDKVEDCSASLNDNLGNMLMTNSFTSQKGMNRFTFNNINASSGMYYINLNVSGKLYSKKVMILK
jgi:hypothetical protein